MNRFEFCQNATIGVCKNTLGEAAFISIMIFILLLVAWNAVATLLVGPVSMTWHRFYVPWYHWPVKIDSKRYWRTAVWRREVCVGSSPETADSWIEYAAEKEEKEVKS